MSPKIRERKNREYFAQLFLDYANKYLYFINNLKEL